MRKGFKHSEETKEKIRLSKLGEKNPFFGKKHTTETRAKITQAVTGKKNPMFGLRRLGKNNPNYGKKHPGMNLGDKHGQWKGDNVGYKGLHQWIRVHLPKPELCRTCNKKKPYEVANITGIYNRNFDNWEWLCRRCHMASDGRLKVSH